MLEIIHVFVILLGEWRQYIGFMPFMFHLKIQTEYYCKSITITMIKMCWINMKFLKMQLCYSIIHFPVNFHKKFRLEDDADSFCYVFIKFPSQFVNSYWPQDGYFHVHIWTYWRCYNIITQYLTSIFSGYSCTDPYYRWHELQSDSTFPCDVLRIIIQVFNKNSCYSIIQPLSKF